MLVTSSFIHCRDNQRMNVHWSSSAQSLTLAMDITDALEGCASSDFSLTLLAAKGFKLLYTPFNILHPLLYINAANLIQPSLQTLPVYMHLLQCLLYIRTGLPIVKHAGAMCLSSAAFSLQLRSMKQGDNKAQLGDRVRALSPYNRKFLSSWKNYKIILNENQTFKKM